MRPSVTVRASAVGVALVALVAPAIAGAQAARTLTLQDALSLARERSEQMAIARASVTRAEGGEVRARSELRPQVSASVSYDRALASEFQAAFDSFSFGGNTDEGGGSDFSDLPFGRENTYRLSLSFSQTLYTAGRIQAQQRQARLARANAAIGVTTTTAQLEMDVAQAFYDAALSDRLVAIAEATYEQADRAFRQTSVQRQVGRVSEFDVLRAEVARDTLQPQVIRQRASRDITYMRLKQLLELPLDEPIGLAARLDDELLPPDPAFAPLLVPAEAAAARFRTALDEARNTVETRAAAIDVARSQRWPSLSLTSTYGRVAYPEGFGLPTDFRTNWSLGVSGSLSILNGGRLKADQISARADLEESQSRLRLSQELAALDDERARRDLTAARAVWEAGAGTVQQAQRAYEIAELRFREGIGTQLELTDSRLLLQQAEANRAQAARDYQVARVRLALLPNLPLAVPGAAGATLAPAATQQAPAPAAPAQVQGGFAGGGRTF